MKTRTNLRDKGFTLIELMIVIVIIGVLATIVTLNFAGATDKAKTSSTKTSMKTIKGALTIYHGNYSSYPPSTAGLAALMTDGLLKSDAAKDAWGHDYQYYSPTRDYDFVLQSAGKDGQYNTEDDIFEYPDK